VGGRGGGADGVGDGDECRLALVRPLVEAAGLVNLLGAMKMYVANEYE
jgi:hypothetical protein